jgi:hypothetical protein
MTQWPPRNETAANRQSKISHLLFIILNNCTSLKDHERDFVGSMATLLNRRVGLEPTKALTEKQSRTLRKIIYRRYSDYKHAVPSLPAGVKFEDEVRRLLKSQPNPNEDRNQKIKQGKDLLVSYLSKEAEKHEWWDGEVGFKKEKRYKGINGNKIYFEVDWWAEDRTWVKTYKVNLDTRRVLEL